MPRDRTALGAFLRARRDGLTPGQAGMEPFPGPRRVPGLRKEELAVLAVLSPDYYSRLEQGRQAHISDEVLDALARALRLDDVEHAHLRDLADPAPSPRGAGPEAPQHADPGLLRLMTTLDHVPALVLGHRGEVLARNSLLTAVLGRPLEPGTSFVRYLFQDPVARERIVNWAVFASASIAALRREAGKRPYDTRLQAFIDELRTTDDDAARWWADHTVRDYSSATKRIRHPTAGTLDFAVETVAPSQATGQYLVVYTAEPGSSTARTLPLLASWHLEADDARH